jgi:hypothetical protein
MGGFQPRSEASGLSPERAESFEPHPELAQRSNPWAEPAELSEPFEAAPEAVDGSGAAAPGYEDGPIDDEALSAFEAKESDFEAIEQLGVGTFGHVYLARDTRTRAMVVVKKAHKLYLEGRPWSTSIERCGRSRRSVTRHC